jgi:hypothetical protein
VRARFLFCSIFCCPFLPVTDFAKGFCCRLLFLHQGARFLKFAPNQPARAQGCHYSTGVFPILASGVETRWSEAWSSVPVYLVCSAWSPNPAVIRSSAARVVVFCAEIFGQDSFFRSAALGCFSPLLQPVRGGVVSQ